MAPPNDWQRLSSLCDIIASPCIDEIHGLFSFLKPPLCKGRWRAAPEGLSTIPQLRRSTTAHAHHCASTMAQPCVGSSSPHPNFVWPGTPFDSPLYTLAPAGAVQASNPAKPGAWRVARGPLMRCKFKNFYLPNSSATASASTSAERKTSLIVFPAAPISMSSMPGDRS